MTIETVKKLAAYHQYYAVNRAVESTLRATGHTLEKQTPVSQVMEDPASYGVAGVKNQPKGDHKGGVVWHTKAVVSHCRWCSLRERSCWLWITRLFW
ncbi:Type I restriction-modification system, restriction subunit R (EC [uncultured Gammaproteobacteria bacterium]|nr:Type I restriction-modification system, restriction subunit R (EC [uncultured Gammaproteobacteria bacterium]